MRKLFFIAGIIALFTTPTFAEIGTNLWTRIWGSTYLDYGQDVSVDNDGNIYVAGYTLGQFDGQTNKGGGGDLCLTKFNNSGTKQWTRIWGSAADDSGHGVSVDNAGNVYVVGYTRGPFDGQIYNDDGGLDICLTKFNSSGAKQWTRIWGTPTGSHEDDLGYGVNTDNAGNVYVVGYTTGSYDGQTEKGWRDLCLSKLDSNGNKLWTRIWGSDKNDEGHGINIDSSGNIYVSGYTKGSFDGQNNPSNGMKSLCLTKFDDNGSKQWTRIWGSIHWDIGKNIAIDREDNIYVAGLTQGSIDGQPWIGGWGDLCLTKIDDSGKRQWTRIWGSTDRDGNYGNNMDVAIDEDGKIYCISTTEAAFDGQAYPGGYNSICLTKFDINGNKEDTRIWGSDYSDYGTGVSIDSAGNVYACGYTQGAYHGQSNPGDTSLCLTKFYGLLSLNQYPNQPSNIFPGDGATGQDLMLTLQSSMFSDPDSGDSHFASQWEIATDIYFTNIIYNSNETTVNKTSLTIPNGILASFNDYFWRVKHKDNNEEWSSYSSYTHFKTLDIPVPPNQPTNIAPINGAANQQLSLILQGSTFFDTNSLDVHSSSQWQISENSSFSSVVYDSGETISKKTTITIPLGTLNYSTKYYWHVKYKDSSERWTPYSNYTYFDTESDTPPTQPTNQIPANGASKQPLTPHLQAMDFFDFNNGDTHSASQWQIATDNSFSTIIFDSVETTSNKTNIIIPTSVLTYSTYYYWRIKYRDYNGNWSEFSTYTYFRTLDYSEPPTQPNNLFPGNGATEITLMPTLQSSTFSDPNSSDTHSASQWQIANNSSFSSIVYDSGETTANKTSLTVPASELEEAMNYYWHVKHQDNHGQWSVYSEETSFETLPEPLGFLIFNFIYLICYRIKFY